MNKRLVSISMLLMLLISTIPLILDAKPVEASITGPSLIVDDNLNQIHATLGATKGSVVTVKGTVTNVGGHPLLAPWLTGVFYRENVGPGIIPPDLTLLWSPDGINWFPAGPIWCPPPAYPGYQLELIVGAPGYYLPPSANSTVYIKTIANRPLGPTDVEVVVFEDWDGSLSYTPGDVIISIGDIPVKIDLSIWNTAELDPAPPTFFDTIQGAINAASPGQTIYVYDGIYKENVYVSTSVTLMAMSNPVVDANGGIGIAIGANNVVVDGFTVINGRGNNKGGIYIGGSYVGHLSGITGCTIKNNIVYNNNFGIYLYDALNNTVLNNTVYDTKDDMGGYGGVGIILWGDNDDNRILNNTIYSSDRMGFFVGWSDNTKICKRNVISGNTIHNNGLNTAYDGHGIGGWFIEDNTISNNEIYNHLSATGWYQCGIVLQGASNNNSVTGNFIHDNKIGITLYDGYWNLTGNKISYNAITYNGRGIMIYQVSKSTIIHYNNIYNNTRPWAYSNYGVRAVLTSGVVDARFNWWGNASGPTHSSNAGGTGDVISDNVDYSPWLGATFATTPRTYHVNPSGAPRAIQEAVDEAVSGDTVIVHYGTYDEQVIINKSLTVQGTGSTPVVKPSSVAKLTTILDGHWFGNGKVAGIIVANVVDGSSVTVKNLNVDGENITAKPAGADSVAGIFYRETGGTIDTVNVTNVRVGTSTAVRGYGIILSAATNTATVEVKESTLDNYDKNGIEAEGNKLTVSIQDNDLTGRGPLPNGDEVQNGIVIGDGAVGTVNHNTISNHAYTPETWWSAGIMFIGSDGSAEDNSITDCQIGVMFQDGNGSAQDNTVNGGTVGLIGLWAQYTMEGTWTASFVNNTVSGAKDSPGYDNGAIGAQTWNALAFLTVTIEDNQLIGGGATSADGIYIGDIPEYDPAGSIMPIINNNNISSWHYGIHLVSSVSSGSTITGNNITSTYLGICMQNATGVQICDNRIIDFTKGGIVTRGAKDIFIEGNIISTTIHDEAPNGIDIGTYNGTSGTIKGNRISGCSWNGFTGDYETSWSGSGILVIESEDSLEILGNTVHDCDVGMDIESDSMNITCNEVYNNIYGFVFWNAKPKVNYNNIYNNTQYGVYRTTAGDLTGLLDARYNWWGDASGPSHPSNPNGTGDTISDNVRFAPWLLQVKVPPLVHDIAITSVTPHVAHQYPGRMVNITVVVKNKGNMYETFNVTVYRDSIPIGTILVTDLGIGENVTLVFNWNTTGLTPCYNWTIRAEAPLVGDVNPSDNNVTDGTVKIKMIGDLNADGTIDIFDIVAAAAAFGTTPINPEWEPQADLVQDGLIDVFDLVVIGFYFGNTCP